MKLNEVILFSAASGYDCSRVLCASENKIAEKILIEYQLKECSHLRQENALCNTKA